MQKNLFMTESTSSSPLAHNLRPVDRTSYVGIDELEQKYPFLRSKKPKSMILWGPPGSGKTTLAHILCSDDTVSLLPFSAVLSGLNELKQLFQQAKNIFDVYGKHPVIFIDEIHRFNKAQQDALLPYVENGLFTLIGATTENPRSCINRALLSRMQTIELPKMTHQRVKKIILNASKEISFNLTAHETDLITEYSGGDARRAIGNLETAISLKENDEYSHEKFKKIILENSRIYDRNKDRHYDVISAFIKSMRGSDPDAAVLWLAVMLDGGEDPVFIARRLVIFASEDVGNADINALTMANNALNTVSQIGMPEARITLAQATLYLASTVKSNAVYTAINDALQHVQSNATIEVPEHLKNFPAKNHNIKYKYPHSYNNSFTVQQYSPLQTPQFYKPKEIGVEKKIKDRLRSLWLNLKGYG